MCVASLLSHVALQKRLCRCANARVKAKHAGIVCVKAKHAGIVCVTFEIVCFCPLSRDIFVYIFVDLYDLTNGLSFIFFLPPPLFSLISPGHSAHIQCSEGARSALQTKGTRFFVTKELLAP